MKTFRYSQTTENIRVSVIPFYLEDHSNPDESQYVWAYNVTIENEGDKSVTLTHRHWRIINGLGRIEEVDGPGVIGEQPVLKPGESFEYTSGCPLSTPSGFMGGSYDMVREDGVTLAISIPTFSLDTPDKMTSVN